jgi:ABC-type sugar transport system substrate-binding protein
MKLNQRVRVLGVAGALMLALAGCASADTSADQGTDTGSGGDQSTSETTSCKIAIDNGSGTAFPFPNSGAQGVVDKAEELGCEVIANLDGKSDVATEAANVQNIIAQQPDGVVIIPANAAEAAEFVDQMADAGIKVVSYHSIIGADRAIDDVYPALSSLVIEDETGVGEMVGNAMMEELPDGGPVGVVLGAPGYAENKLRVEKFKEVTDGTFDIVAEQPGDWVADKGQSACASMLNANPDIVGFYAISDDMGVGCQKAVQAAKSDAIVFGVGGAKLGIDAIKKGGMTGTVCYKPYDGGAQAMEELHKAITDDSYGTGNLVFYDTPVITKDNVDDCDPQW